MVEGGDSFDPPPLVGGAWQDRDVVVEENRLRNAGWLGAAGGSINTKQTRSPGQFCWGGGPLIFRAVVGQEESRRCRQEKKCR